MTRNFDICALALKLETNFKNLANAKGLGFHIDYPDDLCMLGDEKKIYSMLHHLVDNAIKFTNTGQIEIDINTDLTAQTGQEIVFLVKDSGIGIDAKDHERIFSEVGQLNDEHNREHYGVGLGLYYTNLLAQQFKGKISVESALEQGARFTLRLPAGEVVETKQEGTLTADQEIDDLLF